MHLYGSQKFLSRLNWFASAHHVCQPLQTNPGESNWTSGFALGWISLPVPLDFTWILRKQISLWSSVVYRMILLINAYISLHNTYYIFMGWGFFGLSCSLGLLVFFTTAKMRSASKFSNAYRMLIKRSERWYRKTKFLDEALIKVLELTILIIMFPVL